MDVAVLSLSLPVSLSCSRGRAASASIYSLLSLFFAARFLPGAALMGRSRGQSSCTPGALRRINDFEIGRRTLAIPFDVPGSNILFIIRAQRSNH